MNRTLLLLASILSASSVACERRAGSFEVAFQWPNGVNPFAAATTVTPFVFARVEERSDGTSKTAQILATSGPEPYTAGTRLDFGKVPNGPDRVVVVEFRDASGSAAQVLYYGASEPFVLEAGRHVVVPVRLNLRAVPSVDTGNEDLFRLEILSQRDGVAPSSNVRVAVTVNTGSSVELSNLDNFPEGATRREALTVPVSRDGELSTFVFDWDLDEHVEVCKGVCARSVLARVFDDEGYASPAERATVVVDREVPRLIPDASGVSPEVANAASRLTLTVVAQEFLSNAPRVTVGGEAVFELLFPLSPEASATTYIFGLRDDAGQTQAGEVWAMDGSYVVTVEMTDIAGNTSGPSPLLREGAAGSFELDRTPPEATVSVSPDFAHLGDEVEVTVVTEDALLPELPEHPRGRPRVQIGGLPLPSEECAWSSASIHHCRHRVTASEQDGTKSVSVALTDRAGNSRTLEAGSVRYDVTGPRVASEALVREPFYEPAVVGSTVHFTNRDPTTPGRVTARLFVSADEALSGTPELLVDPPNLQFRLAGQTGNRVVFEHTFADPGSGVGLEAEGTYHFLITWRDQAQNTVTVPLESRMVIDRQPPPSGELDLTRVVYHRAPWGDAASPGVPSFQLFGAAGATNPDRAVGVIAYSVGRAAPEHRIGYGRLEADGSFEISSLSGGDLPVVYVSLVDAAGVAQTPVPVRDGRWITTISALPSDLSRARSVAHLEPSLAQEVGLERPIPRVGRTALQGIDGASFVAKSETAWRQRAKQAAPAATEATLVYDVAAGRTLLFTPSSAQVSTWAFDGLDWETICDGARLCLGPPALAGAAVGYDASSGSTVLFGGSSGGSHPQTTWSWDGVRWSETCAGGARCPSPSGRRFAAMAFDHARGELVLFGGRNDSSSLSDTWAHGQGTWRSVSTTTPAPSGRSRHALAFDRTNRELVLFGGEGPNGAKLGDTWVLVNDAWTPRQPASAPSARAGHTTAFDETNGVVVLFGGEVAQNGGCGSGTGTLCNDTWLWNGMTRTWTRQPVTSPPPASASASMIYDPHRRVVVLRSSGRTFEWTGRTWRELTSSSTPRLDKPIMAFDQNRERTVLVGFNLTSGRFEVWEWDGAAWSATCPGCDFGFEEALAYAVTDAGSGVIATGGRDSGGAQSDTQLLTGGGAVTVDSFWTGRYAHAVAFDEDLRQSVLMGGEGWGDQLGDTQMLGESGWRTAWGSGRGNLPVLSYHAMAWNGGSVVTFGGGTNNRFNGSLCDGQQTAWLPPASVQFYCLHNDVWRFDPLFEEWSRLRVSTASPAPRARHGLAYDREIGAVLLFGGENHTGILQDTWQLEYASGTNSWQWSRVAQVGALPAGGPVAMAEARTRGDPARPTVLLSTGTETWEWNHRVETRPAVLWTAQLRLAGLATAPISSIRVTAVADARGARGTPLESRDAELLVWDRSAWRRLATLTPTAAFARATVTLTDPDELRRLPFGWGRELHFAVAPRVARGQMPGDVRVDHVQVEVEYRRVCGDRRLDEGEECDDGNAVAGDGCSLDCTVEGACGDGIRSGGEACDDGARNSDTEPGACRTDCRAPWCGDGVLDSGETCEPPGVGLCDSSCFSLWVCAPESYEDQFSCDCGCGLPDPDCGGGGCSDFGCSAPGCDFCFGGSCT